ncbi:NAD(P)H-hydrate dehydratase [Chitinispirillales bacterium ANBcel5]|uniref:NAD(P)H-hydrate dehydratase n=1 Tax=Cellulosispirillum alkaliphilum TaxID=3039283 RepID=UPI002A4FF7A0|nr:NAD(P)H-hydrate dehydratase [Chitinispirillales bacterium ANBcel5]
MISVVSTAQMRNIDKETINGDLTVGYSLMLEAGRGVFEEARKMLGYRDKANVAIFCGKGNNGGDGYVAAKMLMENGYTVIVFSLYDISVLKGEAKVASDEYLEKEGTVRVINDTEMNFFPDNFDLIIDALLGTGVKGDPGGVLANVIRLINELNIPVLSVDTPSGLNGDTGQCGNPCVRADRTITMGFPKIGQFFYPGRDKTGKLITRTLSYPEKIVSANLRDSFLPTKSAFAEYLPARKSAGSKFEHGLALLISGSKGMSGSATLAANAAFRTGCGMVHMGLPESLIDIMSVKLTETVLHPMEQTQSGTISTDALENFINLASGKDAICIGPGLSHNLQTTQFIRKTITKTQVPIVLDADGINAFKDKSEELMEHKGEIIITPHRGEWKRVFGELPTDPLKLIDILKITASKYNITILLKGNPTIVAGQSGSVFILPFGSSALATAGSGDVLSGIIVSLLAQGVKPIEAAILGQFIHGEAAKYASEEMTEYSVIASDLPHYIPKVFKDLLVLKTEANSA